MLKDYLSSSELKEMVILTTTRELVEHFVSGNVMTKEEKTNLKRGSTFIKKALANMINRLGGDEAKKFVRTFDNSKVVVHTDSELEVIAKRKDAELNAAYEDNKEYFGLVEIIMDKCCKNCTGDWKTCQLCKHFNEQEVIPIGDENETNCKYAYRLELTKEERNKVDNIESKIRLHNYSTK